MKKRFFSFLIAIFVFILNSVSIFAWTSDNFISYNGYVPDSNHITIMTDNPNYNFYYVVFTNGAFKEKHLVYSSSDDFIFQIVTGETDFLQYVNNSSESIDILSTHSSFRKTVAANSIVSFRYAKEAGYSVLEKIVNSKNQCISQNFCDPSIYVDPESADDYEEDGVVIKGLTSFFNNVTSKLNSIVDDLITKLKELIGLPPDGYFNSKFEEIKTNLDNKYNFSSVFEIFNNLKSIQAQKPVFDKTFNFSFDDINIPFHFKIDFDFIDSIRDYLFAFIRAFGYFYLIIYNMNQYYLLFRGQRFFYDMRDSYSYTDSNGKEHSHERGEKKWY